MLIVILLVGAVFYLLGERSVAVPDNDGAHPEPERPAAQQAEKPSPAEPPKPSPEELAAERAKLKRPVSIGNGGPYESACTGIGSVANLPGGNDNYLNVREGPSAKAKATDRLGDDQPIYLCDQTEDGSWIGIVYMASGYLPVTDECGVEDLVASRRPYAGNCQSGWVSAKYVEVRTQG
ncbi:hypothetical protein AAG614_15295 [Citromicrobium bathyomarinum]